MNLVAFSSLERLPARLSGLAAAASFISKSALHCFSSSPCSYIHSVSSLSVWISNVFSTVQSRMTFLKHSSEYYKLLLNTFSIVFRENPNILHPLQPGPFPFHLPLCLSY